MLPVPTLLAEEPGPAFSAAEFAAKSAHEVRIVNHNSRSQQLSAKFKGKTPPFQNRDNTFTSSPQLKNK